MFEFFGPSSYFHSPQTNTSYKRDLMKFEPLSEVELQTYKCLKKYLKRYKDLELQSILPYCFKNLGKRFEKIELTDAVNQLMEKRYIIKGSSLSRDDMLHNPIRKRILHFIQINPGAYNRLIRRELNIGSNEFSWHMGMLEKFGYTKRILFNNRNYGYFENKSFMNHEFDLFLLRNEKISRILKYLENANGNLSQIAKNLDMHYSTVQKHLTAMKKRELVYVQMKGKHQYYYLNDDMMLKLRKIVNGGVFIEFANTVN
jgi:predicted transcriptional regulator